ncbi:TPA: flagellar hook-basal body complex protein FliE [Candidatus Galligastranaerophilus intestinavium]|uniref:Flagellar hook-basal body complex protein FliE n=1 Tax=Candidatus Galligastranaerophilus intestinavium TaxID=2840836 RepID=A0A9D1FGW6_9BACT|nr:flagellar hook-basal body complex protein FliE [Candidatus Galligastranaerophilus intestinavium]
MNFEINTNISSIDNFNKSFDKSIKNFDKQIDDASDFNEVFNSLTSSEPKNTKEPQKLKGSVEMFLGADAINAQKVENLSETALMARDIGQGFSNGISNLSATQKTAEDAMETFAAGGDISVHEVMIASQKSTLAMQMAIQLRNQMINAYSEFKNLRV